MDSPRSYPPDPRWSNRPLTVIAVQNQAAPKSRKRLWLLLGAGAFVLVGLFLAAVVSLGWALSTVVRQARAEKQSWDHNERGNRFSRQGQEDRAIAEYDEAIRLRPEDPVPWCNRGDSWMNKKEYAKALADANQSLALDPNYADAHNLRGLILYKQDDDAGSIPCFDRAIQLQPKSVYFHNRANAYLALKQNDKALRDYNQAIRLEADSPDSFYGRGLVYHNLGKLTEALNDYHQAIQLQPSHAEAHRSIGSVYIQEKNHRGAIEPLNKAIELKPDYAVALNDRGLCAKELGDPKLALTYYDKAIKFDPKEPVYFVNRGHAYYDLKEPAKAIADYDVALRMNPKDGVTYSSRGNAHSQLHNYDAALKDHDEAVRLRPGEAVYYQNRGHTLSHAKQYAKALADYEECLRLDPDSSDYQTDVAWLLATCPDAKVRNGKRAVELALQAVDNDDDPPSGTAEVLAAAYAETGDFKAAVKWQKQALKSADQLSEEDRKNAQDRLQSYTKRKPWRTD